MITIFPTKINGIPCQCEVTHYRPYQPVRWANTMEDSEPENTAEFEFRILDRNGKPASWLQRYVKQADEDRLFNEFEEHRQYMKDNQ